MADEQTLSTLLGKAMPGVMRSVGGPLPRSFYRYVWQVSSTQQIRLSILTVLLFPLSLAPIELQRLMVNHAVERRALSLLAWMGAAYLVVLVLHAGLKFWQQNYQARLGEHVVRLLRRRIVDLAFGSDDTTTAETAPDATIEGARVSIVSAETERLGGFVGESIAVPLLNAGIATTMLVYMMVVSPIIAAVSLALLVPVIYVTPRIQARINKLTAERIAELRALGNDLVDARQGDGEAVPHERMNRRTDTIFGLRARIYLFKFLAKGLANLIGHLGPLAILTVGGWLVIEGRTEIGTIVAFISANERLLDPSRELLGFYRQWQVARVHYRLYREAVTESPP